MDPLAHTLAGASLAQAGLKRLTPLAAPTLVIGANLPDIDAVAMLWGGDFALCVRRGWTHGVLAMALLPLALAGVMLLVDRLRRARSPGAEPARAAPLVALALLGAWTHPALDWINTYGIRLLMPFSGQWFYGDAVFIIDPWLWLLFGAGVVLATTRRATGVAAWALLGAAISWLLIAADEVPGPARFAWLTGVAAIVAARLRWRDPRQVATVARVCAGTAGVYILLMIAGSAVARGQAARWLDARGTPARQVMAGPLPANPLVREIIAVHADHYSFHVLDLLSGEVRPFGPDMAVGGPTPVTEAARRAPSMRGLDNWLRFPAYEVRPMPDGGYQVTIRDVRYSRLGTRARGIGQGYVELDADLRPR
ncbi:MAG: metal-dependent hydrolase [Vicinamibacterales bacterium]|jgi:inner membrane protein|nr:metal-dependent hydrolase [Vicinamibacterales bacterium]